MTKVLRLVKVALAVIVDDDIWHIFKFNSRHPQRRLLNLKFYQKPTLRMPAVELSDFKTSILAVCLSPVNIQQVTSGK